MRSRGGDCKHQLDGKFSNTLNRERFAFVRYCAGRQEKEFMIISTSQAPTLSAFLVVYSSSRASAVQFCLRGGEGGFLVSPENCTFTASGENHLASCLKKKANTWTFVTSHFYRTAGFSARFILRSGAHERKKMKGFSRFWQAGNAHCYYKTLVKLHRAFKC